MGSLKKLALLVGMIMVSLFSMSLFSTVAAQNKNGLAQEVISNDGVPVGTIVSLSEGNPKEVVLATLANSKYLFGVVSTTGQTLAEIGSKEEGTPVATNGDVSVVVSTIYGDISAGDVVSVSEIMGVAAKANAQLDNVTTVGIALEDFNASSSSAKTVTSTTDGGETNQITIGAIPIRLAVNNFYAEEASRDTLLVSVGERLIGRPVSQLQTIIAASVVMVSVIVGGIIIWNAVHGGFISIGRNPLSGNAVFNGVLYITILSIAIMVGGFVSAYLVLLL